MDNYQRALFVKPTRTLFESIATGAGSIAGSRGALFTHSGPVPDVSGKTVVMSPYAPTKRKKKIAVRRLRESNEVTAVTTSSLRDLLRQKQRERELQDETEVFALEDNDGCIVKVYVKKDQADSFKSALEMAIAGDGDDRDQPREIAEVLFDLHNSFEIVSVDWGEGSIPEDEEQIKNSTEAEAKGFPDDDELGDVEAEQQGDGNTNSDTGDWDVGDDQVNLDAEASTDGAPSITPEVTDGAVDHVKILNQIVSLLQAQADAQRAKAEAEKAQAEVAAAEAAGKAAAQYASHQEEVMDMDNYNKKRQDEKRQNQIQAKLIRYRHDLRKDADQTLDDKLNDPEHLLNTLHKASIGESMQINPPTPEEEEVLHMEDWEKEQKTKKQQEQLRDRLMRYKHAKKKEGAGGAVDQSTGTQATAPEPASSGETGKFDAKKARLMDYLTRIQGQR